tara:strand:- start:319 stop:1125 length:807 start_codon:yes stop_codon:yes gene_type:complete
MKNIFKYILAIVLVSTFSSCEEDLITFDNSGQTAVSFTQTSFNLSIPVEDLALDIPTQITTVSSVDRTFSAVIENATENTDSEYSIGSVVIPAGSYTGVLTINFDYSEISGEDGDVKEFDVKLVATDGVSTYFDVASIIYFREIVCNDLTLEIVSDVWATETYWTLKQADGTALVERFFPYTGNSITPQTYTIDFPLVDGDYSLEIGDVYGDGMVGTGGGVTLTGTYALTCSILVHASGNGAFSNAVADPFPGAANAEVEVTDFTVNP